MVRQFGLVNEDNLEYSLMDIEKYCLLTEPSGLGILRENEYGKVQNTFIPTKSDIQQGVFNGTINTLKYSNFRDLVNFIESSSKLKLYYVVPYEDGARPFYRDINISTLDKTEKQTTGAISEPISFDLLTPWYQQFDYMLNGKDIEFTNDGHADAPILLQMYGPITDPSIDFYVDNDLQQDLLFTTEVESGEMFLYNTKENEFCFEKIKSDGTSENLYNFDVISTEDFENKDFVIRLPKNRKSRISTNATSGSLTIFKYFETV